MDLEILRFFQGIGCGFCDYIFSAITVLGEIFVFVALIPLIYWCFDKALGEEVAVSVLSGSYVNYLIKGAVARVRPIGREGVRRARFDYFYDSLKGENGLYVPESFPSGHSQASASFYSALSYKKGFRRFWWLLLIPVVIGYSRLYLGVHWPSDVLVGLLEGFLISWLIHLSMKKNKRNTLLVVPVIAAALVGFAFGGDLEQLGKTFMLLGLLWGASLGIILENYAVKSSTDGLQLWKRLVRIPVGLLAVVLTAGVVFLPLWLFGVGKTVIFLPASVAAGFGMTAVAPLLFKKLGLN